jgi:DMSO/TMAO reductase YedYZ heme-binding membrane subunit
MRRRVRVWFWLEAALAGVSAFLLVLTLVWRDWIKGVFGVDPDRHSGSVEWLTAGGLLFLTIAFALIARGESRRPALSS